MENFLHGTCPTARTGAIRDDGTIDSIGGPGGKREIVDDHQSQGQTHGKHLRRLIRSARQRLAVGRGQFSDDDQNEVNERPNATAAEGQ